MQYNVSMKQVTLSAGAVVVRKNKNQWEFLLLRAFAYWDFPKGMVEADENPWSAALREITEETGITNVHATWGNRFTETEPYGKGKVARYYLVEAASSVEIKLQPNPVTGIIEHHEYKWLNYHEARQILVPRVQRVIDWAHKKLL